MRDPERINIICKLLAEKWRTVPDMRLGQFLCNLSSTDIFYIEDGDLLEKLTAFQIETNKPHNKTNTKCQKCKADQELCNSCSDNPKYANYPQHSHFAAYIPTCPRGYTDCIYDPAYIYHYSNEWYHELYGDKTPEEAAKTCLEKMQEDPDEEYSCYDNEDK